MKAQQLIDSVLDGKDPIDVLNMLSEDQREFVTTQLKLYRDKLKRNPKDKRIRQEIASLSKMASDMGISV